MGGGGRMYSEKVFYGEVPPLSRSDPLPFYIPFLTEKVTFLFTLIIINKLFISIAHFPINAQMRFTVSNIL